MTEHTALMIEVDSPKVHLAGVHHSVKMLLWRRNAF